MSVWHWSHTTHILDICYSSVSGCNAFLESRLNALHDSLNDMSNRNLYVFDNGRLEFQGHALVSHAFVFDIDHVRVACPTYAAALYRDVMLSYIVDWQLCATHCVICPTHNSTCSTMAASKINGMLLCYSYVWPMLFTNYASNAEHEHTATVLTTNARIRCIT